MQALSMRDGKVVWDEKRCIHCDACIRICKHTASAKIRYMDVRELVKQVAKYRSFIRGITVSGGECMNHAAFLTAFFRQIKKMQLHILIDTNGFHDFRQYEDVLHLCDGVMLDVKAVNEQFHRQLCAKSNETVLRNLDYLLDKGKMEEVRTVLLPHYEKENRETIAYVVKHINNRCRYKLIAYRPYGVREAGLHMFGTIALNKAEMQAYLKFAESLGSETCTIV